MNDRAILTRCVGAYAARQALWLLAIGLVLPASDGRAGARVARADTATLSCRQILRLGLEGYMTWCEERLRPFDLPQKKGAWSTYARCRRQSNQASILRLPPERQRNIERITNAVNAWERSYLYCVGTDAHSASMDSYLWNWALPRREDLYAAVISDASRSQRSGKGTPELRQALTRAEQRISRWRQTAATWKIQGREDAGRAVGASELTKELPEQQRYLRSLEAAILALPTPSQKRAGLHMLAFMRGAEPKDLPDR